MQPRGSASAPSQHVSFSEELGRVCWVWALGELRSSQRRTNDPHAKLSSSKQLRCGRPNGALEDGKINREMQMGAINLSACGWEVPV